MPTSGALSTRRLNAARIFFPGQAAVVETNIPARAERPSIGTGWEYASHDDVRALATDLSDSLGEVVVHRPRWLMYVIVEEFGIDFARERYAATVALEAKGGMTRADGRRYTPRCGLLPPNPRSARPPMGDALPALR